VGMKLPTATQLLVLVHETDTRSPPLASVGEATRT
jgi:hypothetical protein